MPYDFLIESYETERGKVVSVWSEFTDEDLCLRQPGCSFRRRSIRRCKSCIAGGVR